MVDAAGAGLSVLFDSLVLDESDAGFDSDVDSLDEDEAWLSLFESLLFDSPLLDSPPFESPPPDFRA